MDVGNARVDTKSLWNFCSKFCSSNCEHLLVLLLSHGADLNKGLGLEERTALHCAVLNTQENKVEGLSGAVHMLSLLLKYGAYINSPNSQGDTALHWAIYRGRLDIIKFLVAKVSKDMW